MMTVWMRGSASPDLFLELVETSRWRVISLRRRYTPPIAVEGATRMRQ